MLLRTKLLNLAALFSLTTACIPVDLFVDADINAESTDSCLTVIFEEGETPTCQPEVPAQDDLADQTETPTEPSDDSQAGDEGEFTPVVEKFDKFDCELSEDKSLVTCNGMEIELSEGRNWEACSLKAFTERDPVVYQLNCTFTKEDKDTGDDQGEDKDGDDNTDDNNDGEDKDDDADTQSMTEQCVKDAVKPNRHPHTAILFGIGKFSAGDDLKFTEDLDNGTAKLEGTIFDKNDPMKKFFVSVDFTGRTEVAPQGSPKKELHKQFYLENGGTVDPTGWVYYETTQGALIGLEKLNGGLITITRKGPAFQVGFGASGKNTNFGASGWFNYTTVEQPDNTKYAFPSKKSGDFNIDLMDCDNEPAPQINFDYIAMCEDEITLRTIDPNANPNGMVLDPAQAITPATACLAGKDIDCNFVNDTNVLANEYTAFRICVDQVDAMNLDNDASVDALNMCLMNAGLNQCGPLQ